MAATSPSHSFHEGAFLLSCALALGALIGPASLAETEPPGTRQEQAHSTQHVPDVAQVFRHQAMATEFEFTLYAWSGGSAAKNLDYVAEAAFAAVDALEDLISNWRPSSQISRINARAAVEPTRAFADIINLILYSKQVHRDTDGAFDVTVGPLIKLYGFYRGQGQLPSESELTEARSRVGLDKVTVNQKDGTVSYAKEGMLLDFGGIGKGLALDKAAAILRKHGITTALLNAGTSSVVVLGAPPHAKGWTVKIRHPHRDNDTIDEVVIKDESLSTSGCYGTQLVLDGKTICHIFDPRTGKPIEGMLTVAVIAPSGIQTDALSTAFMVLGPERTRHYCAAHPEVRAVIVADPGTGEPKPEHINFEQERGSGTANRNPIGDR